MSRPIFFPLPPTILVLSIVVAVGCNKAEQPEAAPPKQPAPAGTTPQLPSAGGGVPVPGNTNAALPDVPRVTPPPEVLAYAENSKQLAAKIDDLKTKLDAADAAAAKAADDARTARASVPAQVAADPQYVALKKASDDAESRVKLARQTGDNLPTISREWMAAKSALQKYLAGVTQGESSTAAASVAGAKAEADRLRAELAKARQDQTELDSAKARALARLSERDRLILQLQDDGKSPRDIAQAVQSWQAAKARQSREPTQGTGGSELFK